MKLTRLSRLIINGTEVRKFQNEGNQRDLFDKGTLLFLREEERKLILKNNSTCRFYVLSCVLSVRTILDIL